MSVLLSFPPSRWGFMGIPSGCAPEAHHGTWHLALTTPRPRRRCVFISTSITLQHDESSSACFSFLLMLIRTRSLPQCTQRHVDLLRLYNSNKNSYHLGCIVAIRIPTNVGSKIQSYPGTVVFPNKHPGPSNLDKHYAISSRKGHRPLNCS